MIHSLTVTNYLGDSIELELGRPEVSGFLITDITGLGPVKANINTTSLATMDGSKYNSSRLESRNIVIKMAFTETESGEDIETVRQKSYKYFPLKKNIDLVVKTDNRELRTTGYVESNEPVIFSNREDTQISIVCPDPYFYSVEDSVIDFNGIEHEFEFPFSNESTKEKKILFGRIEQRATKSVFYDGDAEVGLTVNVRVIGDVLDAMSFGNLTSRQEMLLSLDNAYFESITGATKLIAGDYLTFRTSRGEKGVTLLRDGVEYNLLNCMGFIRRDKNDPSPWVTLSKGDNLLFITAVDGDTNLQMEITNKVVYEGV